MINEIILFILVFVIAILSYILGLQYGFHKGRMSALLEVDKMLKNRIKKIKKDIKND